MTFFVVITALLLIAVLAPRYGADSRRLTDRAGGPPDFLTDPPERPGGRPRSHSPGRSRSGRRSGFAAALTYHGSTPSWSVSW